MTFESALNSIMKGEKSPVNVLELFHSTNSPQRALTLFSKAVALRDERVGRNIKLHGHLGMVTHCPIDPPCRYCSVASNDPAILRGRKVMSIESILESVRLMESHGMGAVHLVGGASLSGLDSEVKQVISAIRKETDIPIEIAVGPSLSVETIRWLKERGIFRVVCSLETFNRDTFAEAKPGDSLDRRIAFMEMLERENMPLKSIVLNGLGSNDDLMQSILYMTRFRNLNSLSISTFTAVHGTPWEKRQSASIWDSIKAMAITRLLLPDADIGLAFGGGVNLMPTVMLAGGGNTFMGMMIDYETKTDNSQLINSCASSLGFNVKLNAV